MNRAALFKKIYKELSMKPLATPSQKGAFVAFHYIDRTDFQDIREERMHLYAPLAATAEINKVLNGGGGSFSPAQIRILDDDHQEIDEFLIKKFSDGRSDRRFVMELTGDKILTTRFSYDKTICSMAQSFCDELAEKDEADQRMFLFNLKLVDAIEIVRFEKEPLLETNAEVPWIEKDRTLSPYHAAMYIFLEDDPHADKVKAEINRMVRGLHRSDREGKSSDEGGAAQLTDKSGDTQLTIKFDK